MPVEEMEREAFYYQILTPQQIRHYQDDPEFLFEWINEILERDIQAATRIDKKLSPEGKVKND